LKLSLKFGDYGGGAYDCEDHVSELLDEVLTQLNSKKIGPEFRREILERVLPFIESGNAGMDDLLYEVAYATCYDDTDWRRLAVAFEAMQGDWKLDHARRIYRRLMDEWTNCEGLSLSGLKRQATVKSISRFNSIRPQTA